MTHRAETIGLPCSVSVRKRVKGRSPLAGRGAGAPQARCIAQKRSAYLVLHHCGKGSRGEVPCRGAGREPREHSASRRNNRLTLFRIIAEKGQGAKSLAGARGGSPASAAHRAEAIDMPCSASLRKRVKGRSPLPGRGAGAPQARRIAQKRSAFLISHRCEDRPSTAAPRFRPYTGIVPFSALKAVGSALSCCACRHWKNFVATCGNSA